MINIPKNLIREVAEGTRNPQELQQYIMNNFPINKIVDDYVELLVCNESVSRQPITVTEDEYNAIISLFKVKGQRVMEDGSVIIETRGRRPKNKSVE